MASEAALERACMAYAKARGCWGLKLAPYIAGLPDRLILLPSGKALFVEFKQPGGRVRPVQRVVFARMDKLGHPVTVVASRERFKKVLDWALL